MASATIFVSHVCSISSLIRSELMVRVGVQALSAKNDNRLGDVLISKADRISRGAVTTERPLRSSR